MEEEFLGGFHGEMQSEKGSSGSFFNGDLKVSMGKRTCPWENSLDLESIHVSDPAGTSGFFIDPAAASSHIPLSSSSDWTQLFICGSRMEDNLGAMHQEHLISRSHLLQQSNMNSENPGFHLDGFLNEEISPQTNNRFSSDGLSNHFSTSSDVKATGCSEKRYDGGVPVVKKPRVEAPSPLPSFKVRKEKLGDRITALQQLVSPFGKTDTASVLYEAIEYIKLLHDQVAVLSTPYLKLGSSMQHKTPISDKASAAKEGPKRDLQSRGLCLVPISNTIPIINDTTTDFWTPAFGTSYKLER